MTEEKFWLMKSEPDAYSIDTLKKDGVTLWDGIRNYQARNFMRRMSLGDKVFFYHSNCKPPGIVGFMEVIDLNIVDPTQFQKESKYFDPKSSQEKPRWDCVKVKYLFKANKFLSLTGGIISKKESDRFLKCVQNLLKLKAKDLIGLNVEIKSSIKDKSKSSKGIF